MKLFCIHIVILFLITAGLGSAVGLHFFDINFSVRVLILSFVMVSVSSFSFYIVANKVSLKQEFSNQVLLSTVIKLFLYGGTMLAFYLLDKENIVSSVIIFGVYYIIYTIFEKKKLVLFIKKQPE